MGHYEGVSVSGIKKAFLGSGLVLGDLGEEYEGRENLLWVGCCQEAGMILGLVPYYYFFNLLIGG